MLFLIFWIWKKNILLVPNQNWIWGTGLTEQGMGGMELIFEVVPSLLLMLISDLFLRRIVCFKSGSKIWRNRSVSFARRTKPSRRWWTRYTRTSSFSAKKAVKSSCGYVDISTCTSIAGGTRDSLEVEGTKLKEIWSPLMGKWVTQGRLYKELGRRILWKQLYFCSPEAIFSLSSSCFSSHPKFKQVEAEAEELRTANRRLQHQVKDLKEEIRLHELDTSVTSIQSEIESSLGDAPGAPGQTPKVKQKVLQLGGKLRFPF